MISFEGFVENVFHVYEYHNFIVLSRNGTYIRVGEF